MTHADAVKTANQLLDAVTQELLPLIEGGSYFPKKTDYAPTWKVMLAQHRQTQAVLVGEALTRLEDLEVQVAAFRSQLEGWEVHNPHHKPGWYAIWNPRWVLQEALRSLLRRALPLDEATMVRLFQWPVRASTGLNNYAYPLTSLATAAENWAKAKEISSPLRAALEAFVARLREFSHDENCQKVMDRLNAVLTGETAPTERTPRSNTRQPER